MRRVEPLSVGLVLLLAWAALAWRLDTRGALARADEGLYDLMRRHALTPPPADPSITVVLVDDESLSRLNERWPMDRRLWAQLISRVTPLAPRAILMDAWFAHPAPQGQVELALDLADALRDGPLGELEAGEALAAALDRKAATLNGDQRLAEALASNGRVVLGVMCTADRRDTLAVALPANLRPVDLNGAALPAEAPRCARLSGSLPSIAQAANAEASLALLLDPDGVARRYPYFMVLGEQAYPSLGLVAAQLAQPEAAQQLVERALRWDEGRPGVRLPPRAALRVVRFSDVLEVSDSAALRDAFADRLVFIGVSAMGTEDFVHTPREVNLPGVLVHAAAAQALLAGETLRYSGPALRWGALGGAALLLLVVALGWRVERASRLSALGLGGVLLWGLIALWLARADHLAPIWPVWGGLLGWLLVRLIGHLRRAAEARRQAQTIRRAFHHYLAPEVVEALVADPNKLRLGGERREITAFFTDIKGFTTLSESMEPAELVLALNECLGRMSAVILEEGGIIDKYIGDAIVAMFGAPLPRPDHAAAACRAAVRCHAVMAEVRAELVSRGLPELHVRIGLASGPALVGNMGSAKRFDYTMIGDTVNLAARLEGANNKYGTWLMCSEETMAQAGDAVGFRELDLIRPKGKLIPVRIFEILGPLDAAARARHHRFAEGLSHYRAQRWAEAEAIFEALKAEGDAPAATFLERVEFFRAQPPGEGWDGVLTMTTK
ncbi:adenylate/guanylate cyclase domain-containing protein [Myxococcota bacterium]|nr:adenylate/guanylate cyclase domain-containing protein [Myxococcota bacterium]MBU1433011.1 adenylate/guanylate cyclase domain-containing protein [Myxococcota bacterium]MBU1897597.1 adenylate/guanylate cyclase domain-containing protein [Myxococcota bacterium]